MSTHAIPAGTDTERLRALLPARLRPPSGWVLGATTTAAPTAVEFVPDLTAGEQATLTDLMGQAEPLSAAARDLVLSTAQTAVGVRYDALTNIQLRALVGILLWREGALDGAGVVRPLARWVGQE